jgi:hypothetical protein
MINENFDTVDKYTKPRKYNFAYSKAVNQIM